MARQLILSVVGAQSRDLPPIDAETMPVLLIGRDPAAGLFLNDARVSRNHCRIYNDRGRIVVEDAGSRTGTSLNGRMLSRPHAIRNDDELAVGGVVIRVKLDPPATPPQDEPPLPQVSLELDLIPGTVPPASAPPPANVQEQADPSPDATVISRERHPHAAETSGPAVLVKGDDLTIGREAGTDYRIDSPLVSRRHARLRRDKGKWMVEDLLSGNGTFLNGLRVTKPTPIKAGDVLSIGPYRMTYDGARLTPRLSSGGTRIAVCKLSKRVQDRQNGQPISLLQEIDLTIEPREFVGLLGGSGCGKSTFMDAINGRRPGTHGAVFYDGEPLYDRFDSLKSSIGYVPQDVIFHEGLPLEDALRYSAQLRLPRDTSKSEIESNIDRVLKTVGLTERRATLIRDLSGGQKKRVSIAMELLSRPQVLCLDEVTSGLDLGTERQMMQLFRTLADDGMTVICITHHVDSLEMTDVIAYFVKGRLAFFGPPDLFKEHFSLDQIRDIYNAEAAKPPVEWERLFKDSPAYRKFVVERAGNETAPPAQTEATGVMTESAGHRGDFKRQLAVLTDRYLKLLTVDRRNVLLLLNLAPAVALLLCMVASSIGAPASPSTPQEMAKFASKQNLLCFGAVITVLFLGLFGAVREIVKEVTIYRHERFINLQAMPYLLSKLLPLAVIGAVQAFLVTMILNQVGGLQAGSTATQFLLLTLVSLVGTLMGLAISAAVPTADWATLCMIGIVIPEILFSGAMVPARGISGVISKGVMSAYWAQRALVGQLDTPTRALIDDTIPSGAAAGAAAVLVLHALSLGGIALLFLIAKDGRGAMWRVMARLLGSGPKRTRTETGDSAPLPT